MSHKKPTPEELDAGMKQSLEEIENLDKNPDTPENKDTPEKKEEKKDGDTPPEEKDKREEKKETEDKKTENNKDDEKKDDTDYKKKYSASSRENQKILAKNRKLIQAIEDDIPEPTEEDLKAEHVDWDDMTESEKKMAKETVMSRRFRERIVKAKEESKKIEKWDEEVNTFITDPQTLIAYPDLEGKQGAFQQFATAEENNSVPFKILVSAFLHEHRVENKPHKGQMFETGNGGPNDKESKKNTGKISLEEARRLRETDYKKYTQYVREDKIDDE